LHDRREYANGEFAGMHVVDAEHNHDDSGDCCSGRIQQQRNSERDLHDKLAHGGDTDVQSGARRVQPGSSRNALGYYDRGGHSLYDGWKYTYGEFTGMHDVDAEHDHDDQGDCSGERIQQ
jgi:hypothetical protein